MKFAHLFNHFSCLKRQLIRRGEAQTLTGRSQEMSLEKPCGSRQQVLEQQEPWYQYHLNSVGSPILFNQACVSAVGGSLQQGGLAWQMLSEATFKAAALNQLYPCKGLLCHWALPEQQSEASEAFRFHQGCPCQSPSPTRWRCPSRAPKTPSPAGTSLLAPPG